MRVVTLPSDDAGEVMLRPGNRRHSKEFKQRVVAEYDALPKQSGDRGSFLRGHRLGRHQISVWRRELAAAPADKTGGVRAARRPPTLRRSRRYSPNPTHSPTRLPTHRNADAKTMAPNPTTTARENLDRSPMDQR